MLLVVLMLLVFGPRHPPTMDEHVPLDRARLAMAVLALVIFVLVLHAGADRGDRAAAAVGRQDGK